MLERFESMTASRYTSRLSLIMVLAAAAAVGSFAFFRPGSELVSSTVAAAEPGASTAVIQKKDDEPALRSFMRQKLEASNRILEGLVTDDLKMVEEGSDVLLKMSREAKWRASNDMLYRRYSTEFVDAVSDMKEKAAAQSIDGTSLAWINATMKCLKCHEWVRNTIIADLDRESGSLPDAARLKNLLSQVPVRTP